MNTAFSLGQFQQVLGDESSVNIDQLMEQAQYGVPDCIRCKVWRFLTGVIDPDQTLMLANSSRMQEEFSRLCKATNPDIQQTVSASLKEYHCKSKIEMDFVREPAFIRSAELVLTIYLSNNPTVDYDPMLLCILVPILYCSNNCDPMDGYYLFCSILLLFQHRHISLIPEDEKNCNLLTYSHNGNIIQYGGIRALLSEFLMLLRILANDLYQHFDDEELHPNEWALDWLTSMLSCALPLTCVLRLWDFYFSCKQGFDLHIYVCLAVLVTISEDLIELKYQELRTALFGLSPMNMDQIIQQARNFKSEMNSGKI